MKTRKRKKNEKEKRKINIKEKYLKFASDEQILNLDIDYISKLTEAEYRRYARRLADIANRRVNEINKLNLRSYAIDKYGTSFGKNLSNKINIVNEINKINNFLNSKTSTVEGINLIQEKATQTLYNKTDIYYDIKSNAKDFWNVFNKVAGNLPEEILQKEYRKVMEYTTEIVDINDKFEHIIEYAEELGREIYIDYMYENNQIETEEERNLWEEIDAQLKERRNE